MSLNKFLSKRENKPKSGSARELEANSATKSSETATELSIEQEKAQVKVFENMNDLFGLPGDQSGDSLVAVPYGDLLAIAKRDQMYSFYLTDAIWLIEAGKEIEIESYFTSAFKLPSSLAKLLRGEALKVVRIQRDST